MATGVTALYAGGFGIVWDWLGGIDAIGWDQMAVGWMGMRDVLGW